MFPKNPLGKRLDNWRDMEAYGIELLTGEACGIGMRLLFDLSPSGRALVEQFLSISFNEYNNSWNHKGQEGWKSILMSRQMIDDLMAFTLSLAYPYVAVVNWRSEYGYAAYCEGFPDIDTWNEWKEAADKIYRMPDPRRKGETRQAWNVYIRSGTGPDGTRNTHFFSGRTT